MIRNIDDSDFHKEVRENLDPIVIMFTGSWCQPCKQMKPVFEEMSKHITNVRFSVMDVEKSQVTANELNIRSVPSLVIFIDGMVQEIHTGTKNKAELRLWIQDNI